MRFLVDQNRSLQLVELLRGDGHDAVHTSELGLERAADSELMALAAREGRVIVSGDTDFGTLLALSRQTSPSVLLFRSRRLVTAVMQHQVIDRHLDEISDDLKSGAMVVIGDQRIRVRRLPLIRNRS